MTSDVIHIEDEVVYGQSLTPGQIDALLQAYRELLHERSPTADVLREEFLIVDRPRPPRRRSPF